MARGPRPDAAIDSALWSLAVGDDVDLVGLTHDPAVAHAVVDRIDFHRLGYQAVDIARSRQDEPPAGGVLGQYLQTTVIRQAFAGRLADAAISFVSAVFDTADIPWVVIKGPALLTYTPEHETRDYRDLDVLVPGDRLAEAVADLEDAGATLLHRNFRMLGQIVSGEISLALPNGVSLDLHWHPLHTEFVRRSFRIDSSALVERATRRFPERLAAPVLDPDDNLVYLGLHTGLTGGYRLLWVRDLRNALLHSAWTTETVVRRARESRTCLVLAVVLDHVHAVTGEPSAAALADALAPRSPWRGVLRLGARVDARRGVSRQTSWGLHRSTRAGSAASVVEYAAARHEARRQGPTVRHPWRAAPGADAPSLWTESDAAARRDYFAAVTAEVVAERARRRRGGDPPAAA